MKKASSNIFNPIVLLILDGWGLSPSWGGNAIAMANPPFINSIWREYPHFVLQAFSKIVGKTGKIASSEIGHSSIGCGRLVYQDISRINEAIKNDSFFENKTLTSVCDFVKDNHSSLHIIGLLSDGAIHSHIDHLFALLKMAKKQGVFRVYIHGILDGIDIPPTSATIYLTRLMHQIKKIGIGKISTLSGRYFAMDRGGNWDRISRAYLAMTKGKAPQAESALAAITVAYKKGFSDDSIPPVVLATENNNKTNQEQLIKDNDGVVFFNFRADRARELSRAFIDKNFRPLWCFHKPHAKFATMTSYQKGLTSDIVFPPEQIKNSITEVLSNHNLKQFHVAESEKYAHITYFFNGGREEAYKGEERLIIASPCVDNFAKTPQMKAMEIAKSIKKNLKKFPFICANIANVDMVGHTGNIGAVSDAIKATDEAVKFICDAVLQENGTLIVTADHGNAEQMINFHHDEDETVHTLNPVPFIFVNKKYHKKSPALLSKFSQKNILGEIMQSEYTLADIAPTILELMKIEKPKEMTGQSLLRYLK